MKQQILSHQFCLGLSVLTFLMWPGLYVARTAAAIGGGVTLQRATQDRLVKGTAEKAEADLSKVDVEKQASKLVL